MELPPRSVAFKRLGKEEMTSFAVYTSERNVHEVITCLRMGVKLGPRDANKILALVMTSEEDTSEIIRLLRKRDVGPHIRGIIGHAEKEQSAELPTTH